MSFIPFPAGTVEAVLKGTVDGIPWVNIIGGKFTAGAATVGDGSNLALALNAWWVAEIAPMVVVGLCDIREVDVYDLSSSSGWVAADPDAHDGTHAAPMVPNNVCQTVTFQTASRGRSYRGRNFIGGLATAFLADQKTWSASQVSALNGAYAALPTAMTGVGFDHVVLSRFTAHAPRALGVATVVTGYRANAPVHTMRRRLT
jgi:hypothetical protein